MSWVNSIEHMQKLIKNAERRIEEVQALQLTSVKTGSLKISRG
jgi:hypothetical protein